MRIQLFINSQWVDDQSGFGRELAEWRLNNNLEAKKITTCDRFTPWARDLKG